MHQGPPQRAEFTLSLYVEIIGGTRSTVEKLEAALSGHEHIDAEISPPIGTLTTWTVQATLKVREYSYPLAKELVEELVEGTLVPLRVSFTWRVR